jgi:hypothetical protein
VVFYDTLEQAVAGDFAAFEGALVFWGWGGKNGVCEEGVESDDAAVFGGDEALGLEVLVETAGDFGVFVVIFGVT